MMRSSEFNFARKSEGRTVLAGHLGTTVPSFFLYFIISFILSELSITIFPGSDTLSLLGGEVIDFIVSLFLGLLLYGIYYQHLSLIYQQRTGISDLFRGFARGVNDRVIKVQAVLSFVKMLCLLPASVFLMLDPSASKDHLPLLILLYGAGMIARVYFQLGFACVYFLLADFEDMKPMAVIRTSIRMMKGNRLKLLLLELSFIPLFLLGILSFGIAELWVSSYLVSSVASYYRWLTEKQ